MMNTANGIRQNKYEHSRKAGIFRKRRSREYLLGETFRDKDILVTGGCGSIGSELVKQLLQYHPKRIKVFDNNESGLFYLQERLKSPKIRILIGDVRDKERLRMAVRGTDIIFHAAALKHVPICEYNPFEAVNVNVLGTQNLIEAARDEQVEKLMAISTDKAVNPINTMGATKLLSEKLVMTAEIGDWCTTKFSCVRFGNVLNSVGSVIPIFKRQIKEGRPVTITSPQMTRFFMTMSEAVNLVLESARLAKGKDIFILKMKKIRITDLAEVMVEEMAPLYGHDPKKIKIITIGIRPGEKIDERLVTDEEKETLMDLGRLSVLQYAATPLQNKNNRASVVSAAQDINQGILLTKEEIRTLFRQHKLNLDDIPP